MIVSHRHHFIFAAIPKTGTHAVRQALRGHLGPDDLEQVGLFVSKHFPYPELAQLQHGHLGLAQVRPFLGERRFRRYFKFAFVRNPFDRFISYCAFVTRENDGFARDPQQVMEHLLFTAPPEEHILFQPQYTVVADTDGHLLADAIGRVETMQQDYDRFCTRIGIASCQLERVNGTPHGHYRQYYTPRLAAAVAQRYARDLELFGYEF